MKTTPIIIDKSFLQGTSDMAISELSSSYQLLMPDVLFYELISSDEPGRSRCFNKLPKIENPIPVTKHIGALLKKELHTQEAAGLPSDNLEELNYRFNPDLSNSQYELTDNDVSMMQEIETELNSDIAALIVKSKTIVSMFPDIERGTTEVRKQFIVEAENFIANNTEGMTKLLAQLELPGENPILDKSLLNPSWALYRWLQVNLLFSLDIRHRYGDLDFASLTDKQHIKLEHDVLDAHYLIQGVLQGAFATKEHKLIHFYKLLCPKGILEK